MKISFQLTSTACIAFFSLTACGEKNHSGHEQAEHHHGEHDHGEHADHHHSKPITETAHENKIAGPHHGRLVVSASFSYEIFITDERKVHVTFMDKDGLPLAPKDQVVIGIGGERTSPVKLTFHSNGTALISDVPFPDGEMLPLILQVKETATSQAEVERFTVNLAKCPDCDRKEYACICDHDH